MAFRLYLLVYLLVRNLSWRRASSSPPLLKAEPVAQELLDPGKESQIEIDFATAGKPREQLSSTLQCG